MKDNKNLTGKNAANASFNTTSTNAVTRNATVVTTAKSQKGLTVLDANDKLARRYSFDDNGGGYKGL